MPTTGSQSNQSTEPKGLLSKIVAKIGELPASPAIISSVMNMTADLDTNVGDVSRLLSHDSTLTAKVLKLANSSYYGRPKEVRSVKEAILILGFYTVRTLVIASSARSLFSAEEEDGPIEKLWRHSLSTAIAARQIATAVRHPAKDEVFISALLHDIGKLVLLENLGNQYKTILSRLEEESISFKDAENAELGFSHVEVGRLLAEEWSLPPSLVDAIGDHHSLPGYQPGKPVPQAYMVNLANHLAKHLKVSFADPYQTNLAALPSAQAMRLETDDLNDILETVREYYGTEVRILNDQ